MRMLTRIAVVAAMLSMVTAIASVTAPVDSDGLAAVAAVASAIGGAAPAAAQDPEQCNHCGDGGCENFHWDNCGFGGPGLNWSGDDCVPGCHEADCFVVHDMGCDVTSAAPLSLGEVRDLLAGREWGVLAVATASGRLEFDEDRGAIYLYSCAGDTLVAQVPLGREDALLVTAAIQARQQTLLAVALDLP